MKFSVNWLREFVELPASVDELAELLTLAGVEIEGIEKRGANFENVVVAQITASTQHPNADRLTVCTVDDGSGQPRQIVCGAKNYKVGDKVPLAMPGAILLNDLKIGAENEEIKFAACGFATSGFQHDTCFQCIGRGDESGSGLDDQIEKPPSFRLSQENGNQGGGIDHHQRSIPCSS